MRSYRGLSIRLPRPPARFQLDADAAVHGLDLVSRKAREVCNDADDGRARGSELTHPHSPEDGGLSGVGSIATRVTRALEVYDDPVRMPQMEDMIGSAPGSKDFHYRAATITRINRDAGNECSRL